MRKLTIAFQLALIGFMCMGNSNCSSIKYEDDAGQLGSAQANSMEFLVRVNSHICKDVEGKVGACTIRVESDKPLRFDFEPQQYAYTLDIKCSSAVNSDHNVPVEEGVGYSYTIQPDKFSTVRSFTCNGEIFPHDRPNRVSASFQVRPIVVDDVYQPREAIYYHEKGYLVLGKHAKYAKVCDPDCEDHEEDTVVKASRQAKAYSESEVMRFNYYGF